MDYRFYFFSACTATCFWCLICIVYYSGKTRGGREIQAIYQKTLDRIGELLDEQKADLEASAANGMANAQNLTTNITRLEGQLAAKEQAEPTPPVKH